MTKDERLAEYLKVRENLKTFKATGFCRLLQYELTKENYPELYKYKPWWVIDKYKGKKHDGRYLHRFYNRFSKYPLFWFDPFNIKKRVKILNKIIKKML